MSVRRCQEEIDADEFAEWVAFWHVEPFGDWWRGIGEVCAVVVRAVGGLFGKTRCFAEDWMPGQVQEALRLRRQSPADMDSVLQDVEWANRIKD